MMRTWIAGLLLVALPCAAEAQKTSSAASASGTGCVPEKTRPEVHPWKDVDALCAADFGTAADLAPPAATDLATQNGYAGRVQAFLRGVEYRELGWLHDARWRLTGEWAGCPEEGQDSWSNEVHPLVKIYYSPEVMTWLCEYRRDEDAPVVDPPPMPRGAMIVKEMHGATDAEGKSVLAYRPDTGTADAFGKLWVDADFESDPDDAAGISWTVMIKGADTADGWYWGDFSQRPSSYAEGAETYNPPILDRTGFTTPVDPHTGFPIALGSDGKPLAKQVPPPGGPWYPSYWQYTIPDTVFPNYGDGNYCIYCHGSAISQSTFSSLSNLLGTEIEYDYLKAIPPPPGPTEAIDDHEKGDRAAHHDPARLMTLKSPRAPYPAYAPTNVAGFERVYPQFAGLRYEDVWPDRMPAQTWDHAPSDAAVSELFLTSDQCLACHGAGGVSQRLPNMVVVKDTEDREQLNLTPHAEWSASPMGLAGRDPIFYAMLESELNRADREPGLKPYIECIQNTCLHCHGNMGQRQHALDTSNQPTDLCADFEPVTDPTSGGTWTPEERQAAGYGGQPFLREYLDAWPGDDAAQEKVGGLGRDGISCTTCHRMSAEDLGQSGKTFTGNFRTGPTDELYGPFDQNVKTEPMALSLGITPEYAEHMTSSAMCGSCHAIYLPVFDNQGELKSKSFEQTTYLEWLNSAFNEDNDNFPPRVWQSCQDCHMRDSVVYYDDGGDLVTVSLDHERIANVQDVTFPEADFIQPDLDLEYRDYKRHTFYGLNVFLNAYFQQFPLLLGFRQQDYMDGVPTPPLLTARDEALLIARLATAKVRIGEVEIDRAAGELMTDVTVINLAGHKLPSGVGFRRAFIELLVLDEAGEPLWASGRTSSIGILQDGLADRDLPSELLRPDPGSPCESAYQPHYQEITEPCQVQIYEELAQDSDHRFTTSFLHRFYHVKDNRLLPRGYRVVGKENQPEYCAPWCAEANPDGEAANDPDYQGDGPLGVMGRDTVRYRIALSPDLLDRAATVQATLYSQATAPYFLNQRFDDGKAGPRSRDSERLYFLNSHLNTAARAGDGKPYIDQYKLELYRASAPVAGSEAGTAGGR